MPYSMPALTPSTVGPRRPRGRRSSASYAECQDLILQYQRGKLELQPGCNAEQSLETLVTGKLNTIRETASKVRTH